MIIDTRSAAMEHFLSLENLVKPAKGKKKKYSKLRKLCVVSKQVPAIRCILKAELSKDQNMIL